MPASSIEEELDALLDILRENPAFCQPRRADPLITLITAACVDAAWNRDYETCRKFWRTRCFLQLGKECGSPEAVRDTLCAQVPGPALSRCMTRVTNTTSNIGLCEAIAREAPCDCLRDVLAEFQGAAPSQGRRADSWADSLYEDLPNLADAYLNLPVREHDEESPTTTTTTTTTRLSSRAHVEVRSDLNDERDGKSVALLIAPASREVLLRLTIHPGQASLRPQQSGTDNWADHLIQKMKQAFWSMGCRPSLITARDPVLVRVLRGASGMECPGTSVKVAGLDEVVDGAPMVGIMDGLFSDDFLLTRQGVTGRQEFDPSLSADGAVRASSSRPGEFKRDKRREDRTIPEMTWACGGCKKLMRREKSNTDGGGGGKTALKRCSACQVVHYCGTQCQKDDWRLGHKGECKALRSSVSREEMRAA